MSKPRAGVALALLALALLAGLYLSGYLTLVLLGLTHRVALGWGTWWSYFHAVDQARVAPFAGRIELAGAIGFGLPLLAWLLLLYPLLKPRRRALHGDARFARRGELARAGLFQATHDGIVIGRSGSALLRMGGTRHALLAAPTRSGKGVGAVIPNLLTFADSVVVLDIKQEAFGLTSGWRAKLGPVFLFNPFAEDGRTHRWNPLTCVAADPKLRITDLQSIAAILYEDDPRRDGFWTHQARNAFLGLALYLFEQYDDEARAGLPHEHGRPTLGGLYRLSTGPGGDLKAYLRALAGKSFLSADARTAFNNLLALAEQTFASVIGSLQEPLHIFLNPILDAAMSGDDFRLADLRRRRMSIYVGIAPNKLAEARKIINLFFSQTVDQNVRELPEHNPQLKHTCLLLLDEFTALGKVDIIASAASYLAGYRLRLLVVIQALSQLDAVYGKDVARGLVTDLAAQIVYTPREQRDAEEYSKMLGDTTVRTRQRSRSRGNGEQGGSVSYAEREERRALMLPQELKALDPEQEIVFIEGLAHPIRCTKIRYYRERFFKARILPKVEVSPLERKEQAMSNTLQTLGAAALAALAVGACAAETAKPPQAASSTAVAAPAMAGTAAGASVGPADRRNEHDLSPSQRKARRGLLDLLELIRESKTIHDITPEKATKVFGQQMEIRTKYDWGYSEKASPMWWMGASMQPAAADMSQQFEFIFLPVDSKAPRPPVIDICGMDFEEFKSRMQAMGYKFDYHYFEKEIGTPDLTFDNGSMHLEVFTVTEDLPGSGTHFCVTDVIIQ